MNPTLKYPFQCCCLLLFITALAVAQPAPSSVVLPILKWEESGVFIQVKDQLQHPSFSWPLTVLAYEVDFGKEGVKEGDLILTDEQSSKVIPFQLDHQSFINGKVRQATLLFLTDLPYKAEKSFHLVAVPNRKQALKIMSTKVKSVNNKKPYATERDTAINENKTFWVKVVKTTSGYVISNGKVRLEIPSGGRAEAPLKRYGNTAKWLGYGEIPVIMSAAKMEVQQISSGPVQAAYHITYFFAGNQKYAVTIKLNATQEFAEVEEEMDGFKNGNPASWRLIWKGINLDSRYVSTRAGIKEPKIKGFNGLNWEPMQGLQTDTLASQHPYLPFDQQNDAEGVLPFKINVYDNWLSWWNLPAAAFWSQKEMLSIGLFIKDAEKWNDGQYALWASKPNLSIYFRWKDNQLDYNFPLFSGSRSTAIAVYSHEKDISLVNQNNNSTAYIDELRRWHGWIPLDKIKDWQLDYSAAEPRYPRYFKPANGSEALSLNSLETQLFNNLKIIGTGTERFNGPNPVSSRVYYDVITPAFDLHAAEMSSVQYKKLRSWMLFVSYLYQDEALMPIRNLLSGHPNFLADIKALPGLAAFLFPAHPNASQMANHFEKSVQLNFNYHIRPDVPSWASHGGRWTENLATYTWAALKPILRTSYLLHHSYDGKNRLLQPGISLLGDWLLNSVTAPLLALDNRRIYPPQGAHALNHGVSPPNALRLLGQELMYYDPILGEKLLWLTTAKDAPFESSREKDKAWGETLMGRWENNKGTNPHLRSAKYTGYGFVLRSGFETKDEMYVHLQQIDEGPNYRWGRAAMGGNGVIYYVAQGKRYSHNGAEDVGDGPFGDVERITNFGVKKTGGYRSIGAYRSVGRNDLSSPLYDFGFAQFASLNANPTISNVYKSRSILQSASDYIVVFDEVPDPHTEGRFSWFVGKDDDFPVIHQLMPGVEGKDAVVIPSKSNYHKDPPVMPTKGRYYDGKGSFLTLVTHKKDLKVYQTSFGCRVLKSTGTTDLIFRSEKSIFYETHGIGFTGTAGIVQQLANGQYHGAVFLGNKIAIPGLTIAGSQAGISFTTSNNGFRGEFYCSQPDHIILSTNRKGLTFYLDGVAIKGHLPGEQMIQLDIAAGKHFWQWNTNGIQPWPAEITGVGVQSNGMTICWKNVPGALRYLIEYSEDGGSNWEALKDNLKDTCTTISGLINNRKIHVRVTAKGKGGNSEPSAEYPVYITDQLPHAPEGLHLDINDGRVKICWGTILGAGSYQLFRREKVVNENLLFEKIYEGPKTYFLDNVSNGKSKSGIYEYIVKAVNGNGASERSTVADTDPASLLNWEPKKGEGFRRDTRNHENGFPEFNPFIEDQMPVLSYPSSIPGPSFER